MVNDRQGSRIIEDVRKIECKTGKKDDYFTCRVESGQSIPGHYQNVESVTVEDVDVRKSEVSEDKRMFEFRNPENAELVIGSDRKEILVNPEIGL